MELHKTVTRLFNWKDVTKRTEKVYDHVSSKPKLSVLGRVKMHLSMGLFVGIFSALIIILDMVGLIFLRIIQPTVEKGVDFDTKRYIKSTDKDKDFGNHMFRVDPSEIKPTDFP